MHWYLKLVNLGIFSFMTKRTEIERGDWQSASLLSEKY